MEWLGCAERPGVEVRLAELEREARLLAGRENFNLEAPQEVRQLALRG